MELVTAKILFEATKSFLGTFSLLKDTFTSALIDNFLGALSHLPEFSPYWILVLVGSSILLWRLKSWVTGLFVKKLIEIFH